MHARHHVCAVNVVSNASLLATNRVSSRQQLASLSGKGTQTERGRSVKCGSCFSCALLVSCFPALNRRTHSMQKQAGPQGGEMCRVSHLPSVMWARNEPGTPTRVALELLRKLQDANWAQERSQSHMHQTSTSMGTGGCLQCQSHFHARQCCCMP